MDNFTKNNNTEFSKIFTTLTSLTENFHSGLIYKKNLNKILEESKYYQDQAPAYQPGWLVALGALGAGTAGYALGHDYADVHNQQVLDSITQGKEHIDPKVIDELRNDGGIFFDKNADKLEKFNEEYPKFKHDIKPYDLNKNGLLDEDEIEKIKDEYRSKNPFKNGYEFGKYKAEDIDKLNELVLNQKPYKELDVDHNGKIDDIDKKLLKNYEKFSDPTYKGWFGAGIGGTAGAFMFASLDKRLHEQEKEEELKRLELQKMMEKEYEMASKTPPPPPPPFQVGQWGQWGQH